jgi:hypothetical protein
MTKKAEYSDEALQTLVIGVDVANQVQVQYNGTQMNIHATALFVGPCGSCRWTGDSLTSYSNTPGLQATRCRKRSSDAWIEAPTDRCRRRSPAPSLSRTRSPPRHRGGPHFGLIDTLPSLNLHFPPPSPIPSPFPSLTMPPVPVRRPSASANHSTTTTSSTVRQHRSADSHHAFTTMSNQPPSFYSSNTSSAAAHQQKIIHILVNRLKNKVLFSVLSLSSCLAHPFQLPSNSGVDLTQVETDSAVDETVRCLVELSKDSLDIIGLALTEVLDKLAKVRPPYLFCLSFDSISPQPYSKRMHITFGRSMSSSPNFLSSRSSPWQWPLDGLDIQMIHAILCNQTHLIRSFLPHLLSPAAAAGRAGNHRRSISPLSLSY